MQVKVELWFCPLLYFVAAKEKPTPGRCCSVSRSTPGLARSAVPMLFPREKCDCCCCCCKKESANPFKNKQLGLQGGSSASSSGDRVGRAGRGGLRLNPAGDYRLGRHPPGPLCYQISYSGRMRSHDCYCFLPMTSLLLQPCHPRKDAIKIFGTGLNDVALQVSNIILRKIDLPVVLALPSQSSGSVGQSFRWKIKQRGSSASGGFAGAEAACWLCAETPADIASRSAARWSCKAEEGPLSLRFAMAPSGVCRILYLHEQPSSSSHAEREQRCCFACIPCSVLFFFSLAA